MRKGASNATILTQRPLVTQNRKSSIPFADRSPKVRFLRGTECYSHTQSGPCSPLLGGTYEEQRALKRKKSILKKSTGPILIDFNLLAKGDLENAEDVYTNDKLGNCKVAVDLQCQRIYLGERQARGAVDIVTFPSSFRIVEPFSRLLGTLYLCLETLDVIYQRDSVQTMGRKDILEIGRAVQDCLPVVDGCEIKARKFCDRANEIFKDWSTILKIKSEFQIAHSKINVPLYPNKTMPENVTLYEDIRDEDERYLDDGVCTITFNNNIITLWSEILEDRECVNQEKVFSSMSVQQQCEVILTLVHHTKDLLSYASSHIFKAFKTITDAECHEGFESLKKRLTDLTFDEYFDPLCGLDLKNSLGEAVERKCELLNLSERICEHFHDAKKLLMKLNSFTQQIVKGQKEASCQCLSYIPCGPQFYTKQRIIHDLQIDDDDVAISLPMSHHFQKIVFASIIFPEEIEFPEPHGSVNSSVLGSPADNSNRP